MAKVNLDYRRAGAIGAVLLGALHYFAWLPAFNFLGGVVTYTPSTLSVLGVISCIQPWTVFLGILSVGFVFGASLFTAGKFITSGELPVGRNWQTWAGAFALLAGTVHFLQLMPVFNLFSNLAYTGSSLYVLGVTITNPWLLTVGMMVLGAALGASIGLVDYIWGRPSAAESKWATTDTTHLSSEQDPLEKLSFVPAMTVMATAGYGVTGADVNPSDKALILKSAPQFKG